MCFPDHLFNFSLRIDVLEVGGGWWTDIFNVLHANCVIQCLVHVIIKGLIYPDLELFSLKILGWKLIKIWK